MPKPPSRATDQTEAGLGRQETAPQVPTILIKLIKQVATEDVKFLHNIVKRYARALDGQQSTARLQRCVQKLASFTNIPHAKQISIQDHNQFLSKTSVEAQVRKSTRSTVLGKDNGIVMSKEQLDQIRAEHADQERIPTAKATGKRGRKRKISAVNATTSAATTVVTAAVTKRVRHAGIEAMKGEVTGAEGEVNTPMLMDRLP